MEKISTQILDQKAEKKEQTQNHDHIYLEQTFKKMITRII